MAADLLAIGRDAYPNTGVVFPAADYKSDDPDTIEFGTTGATGLSLTVVVSAQSGAGNTLAIFVEEFDKASDSWVRVHCKEITSAATYKIVVDPRSPADTDVIQQHLAERMRVRAVGSGTRTTLSYSVGATLSA